MRAHQLQDCVMTDQSDARQKEGNEFYAEFDEGGRTLRMSVNQEDESGEFSDDELMAPHEQGFQPDYDMESGSDEDPEGYVPQIVSEKMHEEKLAEIDEEMSQKIMELQSLIGAMDGLSKSAEMMKKCFGGEYGPHINNQTGYSSRRDVRKTKPRQLNFNQNASHSKQTLARSEEMIYHNAVAKRGSSSEDDCIDISNDSLIHALSFSDKYPGNKHSRSREPTDCDRDHQRSRSRSPAR